MNRHMWSVHTVFFLCVIVFLAGGRATPLDPAPPLLIRNATVIDGRGGPPADRTDVLAEDGRISGVGRNLKAPANATVLDASSEFVMPGLIDTHVHLDAPMVFQLSAAEKAEIIGHNETAFLYNGVTTVLNLSSEPDWIWQQRADQRAGKIVAPRIYATGKSFTPVGGWGSRHGGALATAQAARLQAREFVAHHTDGLKVMIEGGLGNSHTYAVIPDDILRAIEDEARTGRVPIYVHAINLDDWRRALTIKPRAIVHGLSDPLTDGDPIIRQLLDNHVFVVPTISLFEAFTRFDDHPELFDDPVLHASVPAFLLANLRRADFETIEKERFREVARMDVYPWVRKAVPTFKMNAGKMQRAGVKLAVGTDAGGPVGYNFQGYQTPREVELLVESGLTPMEALVAATKTGAELIGVDHELGTLEPGKAADLLILSGNPVADIHNLRKIEKVIQAGTVYARERFAVSPRQSSTR